MKILELNFERTWRGGERQTLYNMQGFRDAGVEVALLCRKGFPMERKALEEGFKVFSFDSIIGAKSFLISKGGQYDIHHAQTPQILQYSLLTRPFHKAKVVMTRRVDFVPKGGMTRMKYRAADKVIAISHAIKDILEKFTGKDIPLISEIVAAKELDKKRAEKVLEEYGIDRSKHILGTTAAYVQHKDPLTMVEAIKLLKEKRNDFVFLHFGNGVLEDAVRNKVKEYGLEDVYKMMGFHDRAEDFFSVFDVFVMSSEEEGLGSSVLDAFIYKVPVVSTGAGGLKDLIGEGRGVMCDIKAPDMLANGISEMLNDAEKRTAITEKAYHYVLQYHSSDYITRQYLDLFKTLV